MDRVDINFQSWLKEFVIFFVITLKVQFEKAR